MTTAGAAGITFAAACPASTLTSSADWQCLYLIDHTMHLGVNVADR